MFQHLHQRGDRAARKATFTVFQAALDKHSWRLAGETMWGHVADPSADGI